VAIIAKSTTSVDIVTFADFIFFTAETNNKKRSVRKFFFFFLNKLGKRKENELVSSDARIRLAVRERIFSYDEVIFLKKNLVRARQNPSAITHFPYLFHLSDNSIPLKNKISPLRNCAKIH
jgi:hypothetical protein